MYTPSASPSIISSMLESLLKEKSYIAEYMPEYSVKTYSSLFSSNHLSTRPNQTSTSHLLKPGSVYPGCSIPSFSSPAIDQYYPVSLTGFPDFLRYLMLKSSRFPIEACSDLGYGHVLRSIWGTLFGLLPCPGGKSTQYSILCFPIPQRLHLCGHSDQKWHVAWQPLQILLSI